ncbi:MAG: HNH endonuclease [Candidatus Riesia sp.]|nr:HNH endonuclease [Candidatus Riesia sp.]
MNYLKIYNELCNRGCLREYDNKKYHKHHIIPRCMGGTDDYYNISYLTPKEHYMAHRILKRVYPEVRCVKFAFRMMLGFKNIKFSSRAYEEAREGIAQTEESKRKTSEGLKGIKRSEKTKEKIRLSKLGNIPWNKNKKLKSLSKKHKDKISLSMKGYKQTKIHKYNTSEYRRSLVFSQKGYLLKCDIKGEIIDKYYSIQDIEEPFKPKNLWEAIKVRNGKYKGFLWKYEKNNLVNG